MKVIDEKLIKEKIDKLSVGKDVDLWRVGINESGGTSCAGPDLELTVRADQGGSGQGAHPRPGRRGDVLRLRLYGNEDRPGRIVLRGAGAHQFRGAVNINKNAV